MHSFKVLIASLVVVVASFAQPGGEVVIRTREGKSHQGRVISETQKGYLFASGNGTLVIPFESIIDIKPTTSSESSSSVSAVAPRPETLAMASPAPTPVAGTSAPVEAASQPTVPAVEVTASSSETSTRRGFHFGLGVDAGGGRLGVRGGGHGVFDFDFGSKGFQLGLHLGVIAGYGGSFLGSVDGVLHFNLSDVYSLGIGAQVGALIGADNVFFAGPVLQPVVLKFGDRGQHQFALSTTVGVANDFDQEVVFVRYEGTLGYTYLF